MTETAGIYCRLSVARYGDTTKVADQERICRDLAEQRGWRIADGVGHPKQNGAYADNNRSAWQRNRKRPGWDALLADVSAGKLTAIIVYHGDRLVRRPEDLTDLLRLADNKGIKLASPTGEHDLDTDRLELWIRAAFAEEESQSTSRRKKAGFARMARAGVAPIPGGRFGRGFGYERDGRTQVPLEANAVREAADRILGGEALSPVAAEFAARGIMSTSGRPLTYQSLRRVLTRNRTAGLLADGAQGTWEPILDRATWEAVTAELDARPAHRTAAPPRYLLSGIAACGAPECGWRLQAHYSGRAGHATAGYGCVNPGCRRIHRSMTLLDAYVVERTVLRLNHPGNPEGHAPEAPGLAAQFAALAAQRGEAEDAIADPGNAERLGLLLARLDGIDRRLGELRELSAADARGRLLGAHAGIGRRDFDGLPLPVRRALVSACFQVTVLPASRRGPGFRTQDVRLTPR